MSEASLAKAVETAKVGNKAVANDAMKNILLGLPLIIMFLLFPVIVFV